MDISSLELIIFDLDGTLINSVPDLTDTLNVIFNLQEKEQFNEQEVTKMVGSGIKVLLEEAAEKVGYTSSIDNLLTDFKKQYDKSLIVKTKPYHGVRETLKKLPQFKKAVLSNKLDIYTKQIISELDLEDNFNIVLGANTNLYGSKPSPEGIEYVLNKLQVKPENTLMVGDSTHDIHAGKNAKVHTCAVTYGYRSQEILKKESPDFMINNISELLDIVNQNS